MYRITGKNRAFGVDASSFKLTEETTCGYTIAQIQQIFANEGYYKGPIDGNTGTLDFMNAFFTFVKATGVPTTGAMPPEFCAAMDAAAAKAGVQKTPPPAIAIDDPRVVPAPSSSNSWVLPVVIGGGILLVIGYVAIAKKK